MHVGLYAGEAEVAAALPRLLDRLEQSPQPRARDVVHAAEVGDDADAAFADALAERGNEGRRRRAVDAARDDHDLHGAAFDDLDPDLSHFLLLFVRISRFPAADPGRNHRVHRVADEVPAEAADGPVLLSESRSAGR